MSATYRFTTDESDPVYRAKDAIRSLAGHLGGEGVPEEQWFVKWEQDGKHVTDPDPVLILSGLAAAAKALDEEERSQVWLARQMGRSWTEIGEALGVSKQAVARRFKGIA